MNRENIIQALDQLGEWIQSLPPDQLDELALRAVNENTWFTRENVMLALRGATNYLNRVNLEKWLSRYQFTNDPKRVGLVLAGNIPLVGLHDLIAVLCAGHFAVVKPSSKDQVLLLFLLEKLEKEAPDVAMRIRLADRLNEVDAVIATGSNNTARYFHQYFGKYPNVIRKNRSSVAVFNGRENTADLSSLGQDIFSYFGLGCRNVSKIFVPADYKFDPFFESIEHYNHVMEQNKYHNNYDFNKSVLLVNNEKHLDNGFLLVRKSAETVSPISVLYYEEYTDSESLKIKLDQVSDQLQCIVSNGGWYPGSIAFGQAQMPQLWDYADRVDTMQFLSEL